MNNSRSWHRWEKQARQFFGDDFWEDVMSVLPEAEGTQTPPAGEDIRSAAKESRPQDRPQPPVDVYKTAEQIIVHVELPGLRNLTTVEVYMQEGQLVVIGTLARRYGPQHTVTAERFAGPFKRVITLPEAVEEDGIEAQYRDGLLEITLPRRQRSKGKKRIRIDPGPRS
jgi:HSP20 family protein